MLIGFAVGILGHLYKSRLAGRDRDRADLPRDPAAAAGSGRDRGRAARRNPGILRPGGRVRRWDASTSSICRSKLSREEEAEALGAGLAAPDPAAADARRPDRRSPDRPARLRRLRGRGRLRQGRSDQAAGRPARPAPRPRGPVRRPDPRREAPPLPLAVLARAARAGEGWPSSTAPGTAGSWSSGSRASPLASSGCAPTTRSTPSSAPSPTRARSWSSSGCTSPTTEQLKRFERREKDPLKGWKLTDEDWRNRDKRPEYAQAVEDMVARTRRAARALAPGPGGFEAIRAGEGAGDGDRGDRGRDAAARLRATAAARLLRLVASVGGGPPLGGDGSLRALLRPQAQAGGDDDPGAGEGDEEP